MCGCRDFIQDTEFMDTIVKKSLSERIKSRKLYVDILFSFLFIMIVSATTIGWYVYSHHTQGLLELTKNMMDDLGENSIARTTDYLTTLANISRIQDEFINEPAEVTIDNKVLLIFYRKTLANNPQISSIYAGTVGGQFIQMNRLEANSTYRTEPKPLMGGSTFAIRYINRKVSPVTETWKYLDKDGNILDTETITHVLFDHRAREWYQNTAQYRRLLWSDPYFFNFNQKQGLTVSFPINILDSQTLLGVGGVDIEVSTISSFLKKNQLRGEGVSVIIDEKAEVVALSDEKLSANLGMHGERAILVNELSDQKLVYAYQQYMSNHEKTFFFNHNNTDYIATFIDFPKSFGKKWVLGTLIPLDVILGEMNRTRQMSLFISFVIFLMALFVVGILARRISKPIIALAEEARRIRNFELDQNTEVKTHIYELQLLSSSIVAMRQSMRAFSKFIPKVLVGKLLKKNQEVHIGGQLKRATLMFTDVANFTTASENYQPDKLAIHLSEYFEEVTKIIMRNNGTIDKYIGDAVMAFWGAPITDRHQTLNACKSALFIQRRLSDLNRKWQGEEKPILETRIGIHTGDVIVGNIGSSDRMNYTALGDTVNLASRLEGVNKMYHTKILISEDSYKEVSSHCIVRPVDIVAVKGREKGIKIYELVAMTGAEPELLPSQEQSAFCQLFTKGFNLYLEQDWDTALTTFDKIKERFAADHATEMFIKRCQDYKKSPPASNWDGIVHLSEK